MSTRRCRIVSSRGLGYLADVPSDCPTDVRLWVQSDPILMGAE